MPPNTRTTEALVRVRRITELQLAAAIDALSTGWARRPFPFNEHYALDFTTLLTLKADTLSAVTSETMNDETKRAQMRSAILSAVPTRMAS